MLLLLLFFFLLLLFLSLTVLTMSHGESSALSAPGPSNPPARDESTLSVASVRDMIREALAEDRRARDLPGIV